MKSPLLIKSYVLVVMLFIAGISHATNYYVDPSSTSSTANGAQTTPWKTLSQVQSAMSSFQPGDFIYFKKGQTFNGTLNFTKSGTASAPITFTTYGTGNAPIFTTSSSGSNLFTFYQRQYIVIDGFKITDLTLDPNDRYQEAIIDIAFSIDGSSYITVKNCDISLVGAGILMQGNNNTMDHNNIGNLRMIKNTPTSVNSDDDYGANPVIIDGQNNNITSNTFHDCWAYSYDYSYDGGAIEFYGTANHNNKIMYNTATNCDGFMEIGASGGGSSDNNLVGYNKIINCNELIYINNSGQYATSVNNMQFFNNVIVHTVVQLTQPSSMIGMAASVSTANIINLKNNVFYLTTGIDVARSGKFTGSQLTHQDNIYRLGSGSVLNFTMGSSELTTTSNVFTSTTASDPLQWNYAPATGSPAIDFGQNLGLTRDFAGNAVPSVPNAGILESGGGTGGTPLSATSTSSSISCFGGTTTVTVSATGGTAPYTGTGTFTVSAGTYNYTVTDAAGGSATTSITVTQSTQITATIAASNIATYGGTTTATVTAAGGTTPYTYSLNSGTYQSSASFTGVVAGTHTITIKDNKGCTINKTFTVTQPAAPGITASATAGAAITCNGGTTTITAGATGGTSPYSYKLNSGSYQSSTSFTLVTAGTHTVTVKDATGATATTSVTISQPTSVVVTATAGIISIFGGTTTITVGASGGAGTYTYKLNNGSYQSSISFLSILAGTYTITAKDKNGCTGTKTISITQPGGTPLAASATAGTISCYGGSTTVTVSATGGTSPYTGIGMFSKTAGTYTFTVTDATGATATTSVTISQPTAISVTVAAGSVTSTSGTTTATVTAAGGTPSYTYSLDGGSYQSSNIFSGVGAGAHSVTVRDGRACTSVKSFTVSVVGSSPLVINAVAGTISCNGGNTTVTMSATGGVAPYTGTGSFTVTAGTYTYTVTDAAGTTGTTSITVTQPAAIVANATAGTITTVGGTTTVTASATGGTPGYTYKLNSGSYQSSTTFTGVAAGTHTITVKDSRGCTGTKTITITQPSTGVFKLNFISKSNESCKGKKDGKITVQCSGGTAPYSYRKNYGSWQSSGAFTNLSPGFYIIQGKSATGTIATLYVIITSSSKACTGKMDESKGGEETSPGAKGSVVTPQAQIEGLKITAYPNPTTTEFNLKIENGSNEKAHIIVMNMNGQKVYEGTANTFEKRNFGRDFVSGMYIVKVTQGDQVQKLQVVKAK